MLEEWEYGCTFPKLNEVFLYDMSPNTLNFLLNYFKDPNLLSVRKCTLLYSTSQDCRSAQKSGTLSMLFEDYLSLYNELVMVTHKVTYLRMIIEFEGIIRETVVSNYREHISEECSNSDLYFTHRRKERSYVFEVVKGYQKTKEDYRNLEWSMWEDPSREHQDLFLKF